jgi:hypothetical protein
MPKKLTVGYAGGYHPSWGILMRSSLVATRQGLPLGLAAIKFWNREQIPLRQRLEAPH